jgi:hypothetical protein
MKRLRLGIIAALPLVLAWSIAGAQSLLRVGESVAEVIVSKGYGDTPHEAVLRALDSAVSEVNGMQVAGVQMTVPSFNVSQGDGSVAMDSELAEFIARSFQGTVLSYKVLNIAQPTEPAPEGMLSWLFPPEPVPVKPGYYLAEVEASVAAYKDDDASLGLLVAMSADAASTDLLDEEQFVSKFRQQLVNRLTSINKFNVIDPDRDAAFDQAYARISSSRVSAAEQSILGRQVAADIIINIDSMELLGHRREVNFSGVNRSIESYAPDIAITYSLLDVGKGIVLFSNTIRKAAGSMNTLPSSVVLDDLLLAASEEVVVDFVNKEFPAQILAVDGLNVTINRGEPFVAEGDAYKAYYLGTDLVDPGTGRSLGRNERFCCLISITSTSNFIAQGVADTSGPLGSDPIVLRELQEPETAPNNDQLDAVRPASDIEDEFQLLD